MHIQLLGIVEPKSPEEDAIRTIFHFPEDTSTLTHTHDGEGCDGEKGVAALALYSG